RRDHRARHGRRSAQAPQGVGRVPRGRSGRGRGKKAGRALALGAFVNTPQPTRPWPKAAPGTPLLAVQDLAVSYGGIRALKGISLEVKRGEIVAMIGANGAGKTTTLKTV